MSARLAPHYALVGALGWGVAEVNLLIGLGCIGVAVLIIAWAIVRKEQR